MDITKKDCDRFSIEASIFFLLEGLKDANPEVRETSIAGLIETASNFPINFLETIEFWKGELNDQIKALAREARSKVRHVPIKILG